jgi:hypothetical protein
MMEKEQRQPDLWSFTAQDNVTATNNRSHEYEIGKPKLLDPDGPAPPTASQIAKLRLILSTYQDGTGQLSAPDKRTLPGWRDFERAVAAAFEGRAQESKHIFDVIVFPKDSSNAYGISCKMRGELNKSVDRVDRKGRPLKGRISMELSNSAKYFWNQLKARGIDEANYREKPKETGIALVELVRSWHDAVSIEHGGIIDLRKSFYFALSWDRKGSYQLHQFVLDLPDPETLHWHFPTRIGKKGEEEPAVRLAGDDEFGTLFEWYGDTGGQLKYYPLTRDAIWASDVFKLEPLPTSGELEYGIIAKARVYFPRQWEIASNEEEKAV